MCLSGMKKCFKNISPFFHTAPDHTQIMGKIYKANFFSQIFMKKRESCRLSVTYGLKLSLEA